MMGGEEGTAAQTPPKRPLPNARNFVNEWGRSDRMDGWMAGAMREKGKFFAEMGFSLIILSFLSTHPSVFKK